MWEKPQKVDKGLEEENIPAATMTMMNIIFSKFLPTVFHFIVSEIVHSFCPIASKKSDLPTSTSPSWLLSLEHLNYLPMLVSICATV